MNLFRKTFTLTAFARCREGETQVNTATFTGEGHTLADFAESAGRAEREARQHAGRWTRGFGYRVETAVAVHIDGAAS
jgi:hypothetical protein